MSTPDNYLCLYILMRTDLASMNPGKAVAQGAHAANQMVYKGRKSGDPALQVLLDQYESEARRMREWTTIEADIRERGYEDPQTKLSEAWDKHFGNAVGFGTCICLGVNERQMRETVEVSQDLGLHCGIVRDPSYPLVDGQVLHLMPLDTCAWVFGWKFDCAPAVYDLKLMP